MCGVIGIVSRGADVYGAVVNGLFQMQHRGQDACGIAISDGSALRLFRGVGYVRQVFARPPSDDFAGSIACGHVRYPTQGANREENTQPHAVRTGEGILLALASNGDLTNYAAMRRQLEAAGYLFVGTNDAEVLAIYIAHQHLDHGLTIPEAIRRLQAEVRGAYSACLITRDRLYAIRDPYAVRPLVFGEREDGWVVASETSALDVNRADLRGEVEPGEIIEFWSGGYRRLRHPQPQAARQGRGLPAHCAFEHVYFSRPDSIYHGQRVYDVRKRIGAWLAEHDGVAADIVVPVPDSANAVALGYAQAAGLPFELGLVRNHYVGRTFIASEQGVRDEGVKLKFNPLRSVFKGKRTILVDDSIVRGTTSRKLVRMVRSAGAAEVHVRIGSPVTRFPCYYGIDTPDPEELIGNHCDVPGICAYLTADSLAYLTVGGLRECVGDVGDYCMACFDGDYPIDIAEAEAKIRAHRQLQLDLEQAHVTGRLLP